MVFRNLQFRLAKPEDYDAIHFIYQHSITNLGLLRYSMVQREYWISLGRNEKIWQRQMQDDFFLLAYYEAELVAFGCLQKNDIRHLYVHPRFAKKGVGYAVYLKLVEKAIDDGATIITAAASVLAKSFFERQGFEFIKIRRKNEGQSMLTYYLMEKELDQ